jgi:TRAP-type C4-dicarboxylate transport system permease small subunit
VAVSDMRSALETTMVLGIPLWIPYAAMVPGLALAGLAGVAHPFHARTQAKGDA